MVGMARGGGLSPLPALVAPRHLPISAPVAPKDHLMDAAPEAPCLEIDLLNVPGLHPGQEARLLATCETDAVLLLTGLSVTTAGHPATDVIRVPGQVLETGGVAQKDRVTTERPKFCCHEMLNGHSSPQYN